MKTFKTDTVTIALCLTILMTSSCASAPKNREAENRNARFPLAPSLAAMPPSPAELGPYAPASFLYASEKNPRRVEYKAAPVRTPTFDLTPFYDEVDEDYWGYDSATVPLNGKLWYPTGGEGPFPLIVCVHGNHDPRDPSEFGYDYLGKLLASRGFVFASIDENFLNGNASEEPAARAILLLEHAKLIFSWNVAANGNGPATLLAGKVDTAKLLLVGHSRGGEAVVHAATFNAATRFPTDPEVTLAYGLPIKGVVSIAPVEGQYRPSGRRTYPRGIDYLVIQGALDGDVTPFLGLAFYNRIKPESGRFKASLWVQGANHAQFNADWSKDQDPSPTFRGSLLSPESQQTILKTAISAFAEASLRGNGAMRAFFRDGNALGNAVPDVDFRLQSAIGDDTVTLANFDEDADPGSATLPSWKIASAGMDEVAETEQTLIPRDQAKAKLLESMGLQNKVETWNLALSFAPPDPRKKPEKINKGSPKKTKEYESPALSFAGPAIRAEALRFDIAAQKWKDADEGTGSATLVLRCEGGLELKTPLSDFYRPAPIRNDWLVLGGSTPRIVFETVRVPFSSFPGFTGQGIEGFEIRFGDKLAFDVFLDEFAFETAGEKR